MLRSNGTTKLLEKNRRIQQIISSGILKGMPKLSEYYAQLLKSEEELALKEKIVFCLESARASKVKIDLTAIQEFFSEKESNEHVDELPVEIKQNLYSIKNKIHSNKDQDKLLKETIARFNLESKQYINKSKIENVVFAGGGAKTMSLAGAIKSLDSHGMTKNIKRVAGTSGGAIMGMAYAMGYSGSEMEKLTLDNSFGLFTLGSTLDNRLFNNIASFLYKSNKKGPLSSFANNNQAKLYHEKVVHHLVEHFLNEMPSHPLSELLKGKTQLIGQVDEAGVSECVNLFNKIIKKETGNEKIITEIMNSLSDKSIAKIDFNARLDTDRENKTDQGLMQLHLYSTYREGVRYSLRHAMGHDHAKSFIGDLLYNKLRKEDPEILGMIFNKNMNNPPNENQLRNINFTQLHELHVLKPDKYKELHVSLSVKEDKGFISNMVSSHEYADASFESDIFSKLPVIEAVRISMNLPLVYKAYEFSLEGKNYLGVDGGIKSNMSMQTFDDNFHKDRTLGVFYKTSQEIQEASDVYRVISNPRDKDVIVASIKRVDVTLHAIDKALARTVQAIKHAEEYPSHDSKEKLAVNKERLNVLEGKKVSYVARLHTYCQEVEAFDKEGVWSRIKPAKLLEKYLEDQSVDYMDIDDARRFALINTDDVDVGNFKLSEVEKLSQIDQGEESLDKFISEEFCFENVYYDNQLMIMTCAIINEMKTENELPLEKEVIISAFIEDAKSSPLGQILDENVKSNQHLLYDDKYDPNEMQEPKLCYNDEHTL